MGETRTRIFLLYATVILAVSGLTVPIFRWFLFSAIESRVQGDLTEEMLKFGDRYRAWRAAAPPTEAHLKAFIDDWVRSQVPEDDNFHIFIVDQELYRANPPALPDAIALDSELMERLKREARSIHESTLEQDASFSKAPISSQGSILYRAFPLNSDSGADAAVEGMFVAVHLTDGERAEALVAVSIFFKMATGVVLVSFVLAWLLSQQLLKPVKQLAIATRSISETNLTRRLPVEGTGELAELTETFNAMMSRLEAAFVSQRNFVNDAGHELRTPITIIQGHLELMGDDPDERQEVLAIVQDELDRMTRFVNDLILLAKAEHPDFLQLEPIDIKGLTEAVFAKATTLAPRQWRLQSVGCGTLLGDRQRITGAMLNLAQNATQHTQPSDTIELGSAVDGQTVRLWVRDTGSGISEPDQHRIFERFARAANSRCRSEGAGLGLPIVKAIAESHRGRVQLASRLGVGSTFTLVLPLNSCSKRGIS